MPTQLKTNPADITLNDTTEFDAMLGNPPSWMMRFGVWAIAGFVVLLFGLAWFIKYPEVVEAKVILVTENPPIRVFARTSGRVQHLLVKPQQMVQKGQLLAVLDNTADWQDVLKLEKLLAPQPLKGEFVEYTRLAAEAFTEGLRLGTLQTSYSVFSQNLKDYRYFSTQTGVEQKIAHLNNQIAHFQALNDNLQKQKAIQEQEFLLTETDLVRQKQLHTEGVISDMDIEKFTTTYLQQKRQIEATQANFLNNQSNIEQQNAQINDLQQGKTDNTHTKYITLEEDRRRLREAIATWKQTYLIEAPITGSVTLAKVWSAQQNINTGDELLTLVPNATAAHIVGKATLPTSGSGKVTEGMTARLHFADFPARQYGIVEGTIQSLSAVPQKDEYTLDIVLPQNLLSTYGKTIPFRQEMQGSAKIVTEDRRVVLRLFDQFRDSLKNR
jgi:multidrug resistance efflux pump